jgi:hypothetical protein
MLFRVVAVERTDSASVYFVDATQLPVTPLMFGLVTWRMRESHRALLPWWGWLLICIAIGLRVVRIQLRRDAPRTVFLRNYWLGFVPGRTREKPLAWVSAGTEFEDSTRADALELRLGDEHERLWCFRPERIARWIEEQQARLGGGLPVAKTIPRDA